MATYTVLTKMLRKQSVSSNFDTNFDKKLVNYTIEMSVTATSIANSLPVGLRHQSPCYIMCCVHVGTLIVESLRI